MPVTSTACSRALVGYAMLAAALLCSAAVIRWHVWSYGSDTGTFAQAIVNTPHGFFDNMEGATHLRFHFSPILAVLWPLLAVARTPLALQIVQVLLICACPLLLAALLSAYVEEPWPTRAGVLVLLYPPLLAGAFSEFHELALYPLLLLGLILAADRARWGWFAVLAAAIVLVREDANADLIVIGLTLAVLGAVRRNTRERGLLLGEPREPERLCVAGAGLAGLAAAALALYAFVILPRLGPWAPSHFYDYPFAHGPLQTLAAIFVHPVQLLRAVATPGRATYVLEALVPLALLPLFSRWSWLALPALAGILLSSDPSVWRMGMHYVLLWAPLLLLGAAWKLTRMVALRSELSALRWWVAACGLCVVFLIAFNPMHPAHYLRVEPYAHIADARRAFLCVPHNAPVATHDEWFAHEALAYPNATVLGDRPESFAGYLVFAQDWNNPQFDRTLPSIDAAQAAQSFVLVCRSGSVRVLRAASF